MLLPNLGIFTTDRFSIPSVSIRSSGECGLLSTFKLHGGGITGERLQNIAGGRKKNFVTDSFVRLEH